MSTLSQPLRQRYRRRVRVVGVAALCLLAACGTASDPVAVVVTPTTPPVQVVLFTHIEDQSPVGVIGTAAARTSYMALRASLLQMAQLAGRYKVRWTLQPDWKFLLAALQYEDVTTRATTGGLNVLRYLRDSLNVAIDAHSHEGFGYNYTDVAHLLDSLGVGGTLVIGGHIWDPSLPQFSAWDRYRVAVRGSQYPSALWRGDVLMGSGTPNHVNDPTVSGVWRPANRNDYFTDDPSGNMLSLGAWKSDVAGISELVALYRSKQAPVTCMLTASMPLMPSSITTAAGLIDIENTIVKPMVALRDSSQIVLTDFSALVATWKAAFKARACTYQTGVLKH